MIHLIVHLRYGSSALSDYGHVKNYNKEATDISLQYQNTANRISSLKTERDRLVELYENASMSDMILINSRIAEIDLQLGELEGTNKIR